MRPSSNTRLPRSAIGFLGLALLIAGTLWWFSANAEPSAERRANLGSTDPLAETAHGRASEGELLGLNQDSRASESGGATDEREGTRAEIAPTATLSVRVTKKKFSVSDQRVSIWPPGGPRRASKSIEGAIDEAWTNRSGLARFQLPPDASYDIQVERANGAPQKMLTVGLGDAGSTLNVRVELQSEVPEERITVAVKSIPGGAPVPGARIGALRVSDTSKVLVGRTVLADQGGRAQLPWAKGYRYEVSARGHSPWEVPAPEAEGAELEVTLVRHARIHGRLAHAVDEPPAGSRTPRVIFLQKASGAAPSRSEFVADIGIANEAPENSFSPVSGSIQPQARLDEQGRWEVNCIPFSRDNLTLSGVWVRCDLGSHARQVASDIVLRAGDDLLIHDRFQGAPALNAQLVDEQGRSLGISGEAYLHMDSPSERNPRYGGVYAQIAQMGRLHLPRLPTGKWSLYRIVVGDEIELVTSFDHRSAEEFDIKMTKDIIPQNWVMEDSDPAPSPK